MNHHHADPRPEQRNQLLQGLLRKCPELASSLACEEVKAGTELYREGGPMTDVYFPTRGVVSIVVRLRDGSMVDVQTVGTEGMAGVAVSMGIGTSLHTIMQQSPGELVRIPAPPFIEALRGCEGARRLLGRYAGYSHRFISQTCVCNTHHSVKQRLCRWLLTCADRDNSDELALTQTMLGEMLGVRRQSVNEVLAEMHRGGAIEQGRSHISVLDRRQLENCACECYETMNRLYARLVVPLL
ncbi:Crp/Fnr family transcriptional regulator [Azohydromonas caseinilytica]|uniref:Crp/Fnr family transcriptional regulator n=1 Tax=Azohydromonas caseinilytica TaxID=2728836 RepID=A0A848FCF5_9BURK|nr:Crp/Fnr family transcriptional regulator [Azohydromonas caseinilytica]NML15641.1 Crp/Fnr family transcriptional regulator [Azohydromonas caseinilytica]